MGFLTLNLFFCFLDLQKHTVDSNKEEFGLSKCIFFIILHWKLEQKYSSKTIVNVNSTTTYTSDAYG